MTWHPSEQVANEIYPAEARTLGCGVCLAGGRLAAMLGPLFFEGQLGPELGDLWIFGTSVVYKTNLLVHHVSYQ